MRRFVHRITGGRLKGLRSMTVAFVRLEIIEDLSYPMAFALSELTVFTPIVMYFFIGQLVGSTAATGSDYFTFAVVGTAVSSVLQGSLNGFGGALQRAQNRGQFEILLTEPVPWTYLPFAMNLWKVMLGVTNGILVIVLGAVLGASIDPRGVGPALAVGLLGILASTALGILVAAFLVLAKRASSLLKLYGLAASLLGGALFSVDQLPGWLKALSWTIPHTYVINAIRGLIVEDPGSFVVPFGSAVLALSVFSAVVLVLGIWVFMRTLEVARRAGVLGTY